MDKISHAVRTSMVLMTASADAFFHIFFFSEYNKRFGVRINDRSRFCVYISGACHVYTDGRI